MSRSARMALAANAPELAEEIATLRKRVAECEAEHPPEREYVEWCAAGKPDVAALRKRVEELEKQALFFEHESDEWHGEWLKMQAHADKAERERDAILKNLSHALSDVGAYRAKIEQLQADLDAALLDHHKNWQTCPNCRTVVAKAEALLEKRRKRG